MIKRYEIGKEDVFRQRLALTLYYYPQLKVEEMTMEDFAYWSENAQWVHSQMIMVREANAMRALGGASANP